VGTAIAVGVVIGFIALLGISTGGASREGSYRRGTGWYLDTNTPRDTLMGGRFAIPRRRRSPWSIRLHLIAGIAFLVTALVSWIVVSTEVAGLCVLAGLVTLGLAWSDARQNRRQDEDQDESE
jgi:peptidoglycan/LPS O-acetylase OafA/YrhL